MFSHVERFFTPRVEDRRDLRTYVARTTFACTLVALSIDIVSQLSFFESWSVALRSWLVTVLVSGTIAAVASRVYGRAQLKLFQAKTQLERLSRTDPLTGLLNRRALDEGVAGGVGVLSLIIVDIDRFKQVNDVHGHLAGDEVIVAVSSLMAQKLGRYGNIARLGGEEFACLSRDASPERLVEELEAFRELVSRTPIVMARGAVAVTVSAGMAAARDARTFADLYSKADRALYRAKSGGRNRVMLDEALESAPASRPAPAQPAERQGLAA